MAKFEMKKEKIMSQIGDMLKKGRVILASSVIVYDTMDNSTLQFLPAFKISEIFSNLENVELTLTRVEIKGDSEEPTHRHTSHLIAMVLDGEASLLTDYQDWQPVLPGDVVIIPAGQYHYLKCDEGKTMVYVAIEISDKPLDYQKHYK